MNTLLVVESPAKAKTLEKYLGPSYSVLASFGHVRDLIPREGAVEPDNNFLMHYEVIERNKKHLSNILSRAAQVDRVLLATDPDREGEAIAWHLAELIKTSKAKKVSLGRVVFHEITKPAVLRAIEQVREVSTDLVNAQQARRALDYLVGFKLSPLLWQKIRRGLSAGRVQSPALRLIAEREEAIEAFIPREHWSIHANLTATGGQVFEAALTHLGPDKLTQFSITDEAGKDRALAAIPLPAEALVTQIERKQRLRSPAAPFTTSTLQQDGVRKLGMSAKMLMSTAQQLYEGISLGSEGSVGLITYMRTDSTTLSDIAVAELRDYIGQKFGAESLPRQAIAYRTKAKNAQEAHEAIRPTSVWREPASLVGYLSRDQLALYELIWKRTVACQMNPAKYDTVAANLRCGLGQFRATGQTLVFSGFLAVYEEARNEDVEGEDEGRLPPLEEGQSLPLNLLEGRQHFTEPPPRFSEATLVKTLEEYGIGRPSTYATIISTLLEREYVFVDKKRLRPTDIGRVISRFLTQHFAEYVDYEFTAQLESRLDDVASGNSQWQPLLADFWQGFSARLEQKKEIKRSDATTEKMDEACPTCGKPLAMRLGSRGRFVACTGFPECSYTRDVAGGEAQSSEAPQLLGRDPVTELEVVLAKGPYGHYIQLGSNPASGDKKAPKPKRVGWPKAWPVSEANLDKALQLIGLPRLIGLHPETGKELLANLGRFGPYVEHDKTYASIRLEQLFNIDVAAALEHLAKKRGGKGPLRVLGQHPDDNAEVSVEQGRFGPYLKHHTTYAKLTVGEVDSIELDEALLRLAKKAQTDAANPKKPTRRTTTRKKTTE